MGKKTSHIFTWDFNTLRHINGDAIHITFSVIRNKNYIGIKGYSNEAEYETTIKLINS